MRANLIYRRREGENDISMKVAGFSLLLAGWLLVLAALVLLRSLRAQTGFVLAGLAVEALGLVLAVRSHLAPRPDRR